MTIDMRDFIPLFNDDVCRVCFHGPHDIPCVDIEHSPGPVDEDGNVPDYATVCGCIEYVDLEAESRIVVRYVKNEEV